MPSANIQTFRIGELEPDYYFSDKEYVSLDTPIDVMEVFAAHRNQFSSSKESFKKSVKRILCQQIKKENEYTALKSIRFSEWEPVRDNLIARSTTATLLFAIALELAMLNMGNTSIKRKSIEKEWHPQVLNVLM